MQIIMTKVVIPYFKNWYKKLNIFSESDTLYVNCSTPQMYTKGKSYRLAIIGEAICLEML